MLPRIARLCKAGRTGAYEYLPASVDSFSDVTGFKHWVMNAGFYSVEDQALSGGVARLVIATKSPAERN